MIKGLGTNSLAGDNLTHCLHKYDRNNDTACLYNNQAPTLLTILHNLLKVALFSISTPHLVPTSYTAKVLVAVIYVAVRSPDL